MGWAEGKCTPGVVVVVVFVGGGGGGGYSQQIISAVRTVEIIHKYIFVDTSRLYVLRTLESACRPCTDSVHVTMIISIRNATDYCTMSSIIITL